MWLFFVYYSFGCALCGATPSDVGLSAKSIFTQNALEKILISWKFDPNISAQLMKAYDKNKNNKLDPQEVKTMQDILARFEKPKFMMEITVANKPLATYLISNFQAIYQNKSVVYSFEINPNIPLQSLMSIGYNFYDATHALSFSYKPEQIAIENKSPFTITKTLGFKVIPASMSVANTVTLNIK